MNDDPVDDPQRPLVMERLRNAAPLIVVVVAATIAIQVVPGLFRILVFVGAVIVVIALRSWRGDRDRDYGPGAG